MKTSPTILPMAKALTTPKNIITDATLSNIGSLLRVHDGFSLQLLNYQLVDRAICETDESLLQLIPYITLRDSLTKQVYLYQRGSGSAEDRLASLYSIGLGGHIDIIPRNSIYTLIAEEACRELQEKVGLELDVDIMSQIELKLIQHNYQLLYNDQDAVGRVHLGVWLVVDVRPELLQAHETDIITNGSWVYINELTDTEMLEPWSKAVLHLI